VLDNLKAAVKKPDKYDPVFNRTFEEYATYRKFVIDAADKESPTHKPHVERGVPYVRENFFRGETFLGLDDVARRAVQWCLTTAGMRTHGTTRRQPLVEFEKSERPALTALSGDRFDTPKWATPKVHPDCHVRFGNALYSAPFNLRRQKVTVRGDSKLVRIYDKNGEIVATHPLAQPGDRKTIFGHYPPDKAPYAMRDVTYLVRCAKERGEAVGAIAAALLSGTCPWAKLRQTQKLLRLTDKYGNKRVDEACARALAFGIINVARVQRIIEQALEAQAIGHGQLSLPLSGQQTNVIALRPRFLRNPQYLSHNRVTPTPPPTHEVPHGNQP
jgi:hypothetical protein